MESPSTGPRGVTTEIGLGRAHHPPTASAGAAARLAPRDDSADHSPVFYAGGYGHPAIESDIRDRAIQSSRSLTASELD